MQEAQVQSLVRELKSHTAVWHGQKSFFSLKKKTKQNGVDSIVAATEGPYVCSTNREEQLLRTRQCPGLLGLL